MIAMAKQPKETSQEALSSFYMEEAEQETDNYANEIARGGALYEDLGDEYLGVAVGEFC